MERVCGPRRRDHSSRRFHDRCEGLNGLHCGQGQSDGEDWDSRCHTRGVDQRRARLARARVPALAGRVSRTQRCDAGLGASAARLPSVSTSLSTAKGLRARSGVPYTTHLTATFPHADDAGWSSPAGARGRALLRGDPSQFTVLDLVSGAARSMRARSNRSSSPCIPASWRVSDPASSTVRPHPQYA